MFFQMQDIMIAQATTIYYISYYRLLQATIGYNKLLYQLLQPTTSYYKLLPAMIATSVGSNFVDYHYGSALMISGYAPAITSVRCGTA